MVCLPLDFQEPRYGGLNFFFFFTKCLHTFISIYFNEYCPRKNLQVIIFIGNLKRKNFCLKNFSCSFLIQKLFANIWQFLSKFSYFSPTSNFYSKTIDERKIFQTKNVPRLIFHENGSIHFFFYPKLNKMDITA